MARVPLGHKDTTYGGDAGDLGYQGSSASQFGSAIGGVSAGLAGAKAGAFAGPGGIALGAAIGGLVGLIGDFFASGAGSRKPVAAKLKPQMAQRDPSGSTSGASAYDPGASSSIAQGPNVRLQAAQNLGGRLS